MTASQQSELSEDAAATFVGCSAERCRHHAAGTCRAAAIRLTNAELTYPGYRAVGGWQRAAADEQFCRTFAEKEGAGCAPER